MSRRKDTKLTTGVDKLKIKLALKRRHQEEPNELQCLNVQLLSPEPSGLNQKYKRIGALESVCVCQNPSIDDLKEACLKYFGSNSSKKRCDLLASERGPSVKNINQINLKKVVHCRIIDCNSDDEEKEDVDQNTPPPPPIKDDVQIHSVSQSVAPSISLGAYMTAGQTVKSKKKIVELALEEYDVAEVKWKDPVCGNFIVETEEYARGGFRKVFKSKCFGGDFNSGWYVLKEFLDDFGPDSVEPSEDMMRRNVQMHMVARHLAKSLSNEAPKEFGETFSYDKAFFSFCNGKPVSIEKFNDGEFEKHINNTADFIPKDDELFLKAETFMHFSYKKTGDTLMVTDIQGFGFELTDPEIATIEVKNDNDQWNFCPGNCSLIAITNFFEKHTCNKFCQLLKL